MSANGSANKANKKHKLKLLKGWICKRATEKFITINQQKNFLKNKKITKFHKLKKLSKINLKNNGHNNNKNSYLKR